MPTRKSLRIPLTVTRVHVPGDRRVRYAYGDKAVVPEDLVLRRWRERSKEPSAVRKGLRFEGLRLRPGTWGLLQQWIDDGLPRRSLSDPEVLRQYAERSRRAGDTRRTPEASKFAQMIDFLQKKGVLRRVLHRKRDPENPGLPDLFLYQVDRHGRVLGGRFVEVKRWNRAKREKEPLSKQQWEELEFLASLGLAARVGTCSSSGPAGAVTPARVGGG